MRLKISEFKDSIYKGKDMKTTEQCKTECALGVHFKNAYIRRAVRSEGALSG